MTYDPKRQMREPIDFTGVDVDAILEESRTFAAIAYDIERDLAAQGKAVPFGAVPYLRDLKTIRSRDPKAHAPTWPAAESARELAIYALSNLSTYRGPRARELKNELKNLSDGRG